MICLRLRFMIKNEYVGDMSLAIHEGMDSRGSHDGNDLSRKGPACH
jgi:hypothetical protein